MLPRSSERRCLHSCRAAARMRGVVLLLALALAALPLAAQEGGRYQAVPIDGGAEYGTEKALIIDTLAGHLWIWVESPAVDDEPGGRYLIYQGQLQPGKTMGEVIDKQEWRSSVPVPAR